MTRKMKKTVRRLNKPTDPYYEIDKGVPMPETMTQSTRKTGFEFKNLPTKDMEVGDSFGIPVPDPAVVNYVQAIISTRFRTYGQRCKPTKVFTSKYNPYAKEIRVWRIA